MCCYGWHLAMAMFTLQDNFWKKYTKELIFKSIGYVDEKDKICFRSAKSGDSVWFKRTTIPDMSYGAFSRRYAYKKELKNFPEKFRTLLLSKMNTTVEPPEEFTIKTNFVSTTIGEDLWRKAC